SLSPTLPSPACGGGKGRGNTSRWYPIASNIPHLVGKRVDAIRHSTPTGAAASVLFSCVDIGVELIRIGASLFGRDRRLRLGEIGRTLLEECRQRFLGFCRAHALAERLVFHFDGGFDLVDEALLEEPLGGQQCAARFCRELLRGCGGGCEQVPV